ncbi:MAG: histidine--tRNA ligase [Bacillota bacterium]|jgi:histidyl-tRNA synthetase|nr:histidine--tRNA ligase [Bacillota bacterium]NLL26854.1 histidine--tRNA ligase [Erysipelotrichia bacterium]
MAEKKFQLPRGTQDIYGEDISYWQKMEEIIRQQCELYGYKEIRTPIFEHTEVFVGDNDSSDMVNKEMYTFKDKGQRDLSLRPEGTKGVIRSFVENKMYGYVDMPVKLYYLGPMFRYDRPGKGRYRQFYQFGIEAIGTKSPLLDVETIALGYSITKEMGIKDVVILINSLGDYESRSNYTKALKQYFKPYLKLLCSDCKRRYEQNPLRMLDCKVDRNLPCFADAPKCRDFLNEESKQYFNLVLKGLDDLNIPYRVDDNLVRGLDYYSNTVYEAIPKDDDGQQATVFAGGQYDGLVESFGGGKLPGVGFGMGMERMIALARKQNSLTVKEEKIDVYVISLGDVETYSCKIVELLRNNGIKTEMDYQKRSLKAQFKSADRYKAKVIIIVGENEFNNNIVQLKDTVNKTQEDVEFKELIKKVKSMV